MSESKVGDRFQQETRYDRDRGFGSGLDRAAKPEPYKTYPDRRRIDLPRPRSMAEMPLDRVLRLRKSIRRFSDRPLTVDQLSYLLWAAGGIQRQERGHEFRTAPSAGALYPIETYLVVNNVEDLPAGVYHYALQGHALEELRLGSYAGAIAAAALGQRMCAEAQVVFVWTAIFQRSKWKYHQRAYRYIYLDAGHIAENLALAATALALGSCQIGALFDQEASDVVGVDGTEESVIYMTAVGHPR